MWKPKQKIIFQVNINYKNKLKNRKLEGWSQDGGLVGHGIRVSAQLGHLPGTGGGTMDT